MTTYTKITDYAAKDALLSGNPSKLIKGTDLGAEFDSIAAADADNLKASAATGTGAPVLATNPTLSGITDSGNLTFTGTGNRITGDFSNATTANRVAVQTSTTNGNTVVGFVPNGSSNTAALNCYNTADPTNSSIASIRTAATEVSFYSTISGTGTYLPITFYTSGSERVRIDTSGNVGVGGTPTQKFDVTAASGSVVSAVRSVVGASSFLSLAGNGNATLSTSFDLFQDSSNNAGIVQRANGPLIFGTNNTDRMRIDASGNVGIGDVPAGLPNTLTIKNSLNTSTSSDNCLLTIRSANRSPAIILDALTSGASTINYNQVGVVKTTMTFNPAGDFVMSTAGGLGYGTGSGGTVTQATSKSTAVTLNKTNGQIVMNNAALASNTAVSFTLVNSTIVTTDVILLTITGTMGDMKSYNVWGYAGSGQGFIALKNISAGSLSEAITINYVVIKAVIS